MSLKWSAGVETALAVSTATLLAILAVNRYAPGGLNADTILQSIMSLQNVTVFYWGQNRFANIIPLLLSPVGSPLLNLGMHLFIFAVSWYALLIALTLFSTRRVLGVSDGEDRWVAVAIVLAASTLLILPHAASTFIVEGQPYALSYLGVLAALWLASSRHKTSVVTSQLAILVALGLNPSVILFLGPLAGVLYLQGRSRESALVSAGACASFAFWFVLAKMAPAPPIGYGSFQFASVGEDLLRSSHSILSALRMPLLIGIFLALLTSTVLPSRSRDDHVWKLLAAGIAGIAISWWLLFSINAWVKANISHFRYFFPTILAVCLLTSLLVYRQVLGAPVAAKRLISFGCLAIIFGVLAAKPSSLRTSSVMQGTDQYASYALDNDVTLIAGDYWSVWPVVFQLLQHGRTAFGLTDRGEGNIEALREWTGSYGSGEMKAVCIRSEVQRCAEHLNRLTGRDWSGATGACGDSACLVLRSTP